MTERREAEQKLRESEERLRLLSTELMKAQENGGRRISEVLHDEVGQTLASLMHRVRSIGKGLLVYRPQHSSDHEATEHPILSEVELTSIFCLKKGMTSIRRPKISRSIQEPNAARGPLIPFPVIWGDS